jgi:hypothetical protein
MRDLIGSGPGDALLAQCVSLGVILVNSDDNNGESDSASCIDTMETSRGQLSNRHFENTTSRHFAMHWFHSLSLWNWGATSIVTKLAWNCHATLIAE